MYSLRSTLSCLSLSFILSSNIFIFISPTHSSPFLVFMLIGTLLPSTYYMYGGDRRVSHLHLLHVKLLWPFAFCGFPAQFIAKPHIPLLGHPGTSYRGTTQSCPPFWRFSKGLKHPSRKPEKSTVGQVGRSYRSSWQFWVREIRICTGNFYFTHACARSASASPLQVGGHA
ncbi:hypothetical protein V8C37DRAFT_395198 [Trichoderma ceciliae]